MTTLELAARDFNKSKKALDSARKRKNIPLKELKHHELLVKLRGEILSLVEKSAGG